MSGQSSSSPGLPYVSISRESSDPIVLSDTTLIVANFIDDSLLEDLNTTLSPANKAYDLAIRALVEDQLYFYQVSAS